jgi:uncharacterized membrane protein YhaH (DUF805 family)
MNTVFVALVTFLIIFICSLIPTLIWYCFDDALALLIGVPAVGTIAWYHMWAFTIFISCLFKVTSTSSNNKG